jgi:hypothetical protein
MGPYATPLDRARTMPVSWYGNGQTENGPDHSMIHGSTGQTTSWYGAYYGHHPGDHDGLKVSSHTLLQPYHGMDCDQCIRVTVISVTQSHTCVLAGGGSESSESRPARAQPEGGRG